MGEGDEERMITILAPSSARRKEPMASFSRI